MAQVVFFIIKKNKFSDKYQEIKVLIKTIYQRHKGRYGYRRITDELQWNNYQSQNSFRLMKIPWAKSVIRVKNTDHTKAQGKIALMRNFKSCCTKSKMGN
jgi:hypothetical protein